LYAPEFKNVVVLENCYKIKNFREYVTNHLIQNTVKRFGQFCQYRSAAI